MDVHLSEDEIAAVHARCRRRLGRYGPVDGAGFTLPVSAHIVTGGL